ncbi:MAG: class II glutamine amidotransferase, partial [Bacteroidia bacterium]
MCGIFGLIGLQEPGSSKSWTGTIKKLAIDSQTRGKDSSGLCLVSRETEEVYVAKTDSSVKDLLSHAKVMKLLRSHTNNRSKSVLAFGHARLVTNGSQLNHENNQPICKDGYVVIHNGIIVNTEQIWKEFPDLDQNLEIDTEVIPALVSRFNRTEGLSLEASLLKAVSYCRGTVSLAMLSQYSGELTLYTNNGSLYTLVNKKNGSTFFASEIYPLQKAQKSLGKDSWEIEHIEPGSGLVYSHSTTKIRQFSSDRYETKDSSTP